MPSSQTDWPGEIVAGVTPFAKDGLFAGSALAAED
jgi:hypothetical protein